MNAQDIVDQLIESKREPAHTQASAYAPSNIALIKYWGKRNTELNLPVTDSLSVSLANLGATTELSLSEQDQVFLNGEPVAVDSDFNQRLLRFINLFRDQNTPLTIRTESNIPIASGLASSSCGFAACTLALNKLFDWELGAHELSILSRLGSGSACRSLWNGFVYWQRGEHDDGLDCYAEPLDTQWPELRLGIVIVDQSQKPISSREAMLRTVETSAVYQRWPQQVERDMAEMKKALKTRDFNLLGATAERNAITMHATMRDATPSVNYTATQTQAVIDQVHELRRQGIEVYFTQDAGPNIKLLFEESSEEKIQTHFENIVIVNPFS